MTAKRSTRLQIERLERRELLAGNVAVFLDSVGNLRIEGDGQANAVHVDQFGGFTISGSDAGGSPTSINGVPNGRVTFALGARADVKVRLKGGDDIVQVGVHSDSVNIPDDLEINSGAGNDRVSITGNTNVGDDLTIVTGKGRDHVSFASTGAVRDAVFIATGDGDDSVSLGSYPRIGGALSISTGLGNDHVDINIFGGKVAGPTGIDLDDGNDVLCVFRSSFAGPFRADGGAGKDLFAQDGNTFAERPGLAGFEGFSSVCPLEGGLVR